MEQNQIIRQILFTWVHALPLDDLSGESIVTIEEIDRLAEELTARLRLTKKDHGSKIWLSQYVNQIYSTVKSTFATSEKSMFFSR